MPRHNAGAFVYHRAGDQISPSELITSSKLLAASLSTPDASFTASPFAIIPK